MERLIQITLANLVPPFASISVSAAVNATNEIQNVLHAQQEAWNRGDIDAFMEGYWRSDETVFVSGDEVTRGWQKVLDRYKKKYSDRAKMGTLTFSNSEITPLSADAAVALGSWRLKRATDNGAGGSRATKTRKPERVGEPGAEPINPHGRFTLIFRRFPEGWKIVHDHTSAAQ